MYAGVKDVRLLNGGFKEWKEIGGSIEDQPCKYDKSNTILDLV
jgi:3-mercaptopyruvate sulfurtransferase SseA